MMPYERFEAWKATHELALEVYKITELWPKSERYELTSQTRRAALSALLRTSPKGHPNGVSVSFVAISIYPGAHCRNFLTFSDLAGTVEF